jgi:hypothetical protein
VAHEQDIALPASRVIERFHDSGLKGHGIFRADCTDQLRRSNSLCRLSGQRTDIVFDQARIKRNTGRIHP